MSIAIAEAPHSAPNTTSARQKEWRAEIHTPEAEYNANVPVDLIERDPANRIPSDQAVAALAGAIEAEGLFQPVVLRQLEGDRYRLIAGEHRWRAFALLKRKTIPARIYKSESDLTAARKALIENSAREGLTPIERARRFKQLGELQMKQKDIATLVGVSQPVVANALRLLELPAAVQELIATGRLSEAHGVVLARWATWPRACLRIAELALAHGYPAKDLACQSLPFSGQLCQEGLLERITLKFRYLSDSQVYTLPRHLKSHRDFLMDDDRAYYFLPEDPKDNVWAPFKSEQDAAREKAEREKAAKEGAAAKSGKLSKEALERKKTIAKNREARAAVKADFERALEKLTTGKGQSAQALAIVVEAALDSYRNSKFLEESAGKLGIKLPKRASKGYVSQGLKYEHLFSLGADKVIRLVALSVLQDHTEQALRHASVVPEGLALVASGKGGIK